VGSQDIVWIPSAAAELELAVDEIALRNLVLALYDREHLAIRRYLHFLGVSQDLSEECIQEAFLRLHKHLLADGDQTNLRAWLFRVARNAALNELQAAHHRLTDPLESSDAGQFRDEGGSPEERLLGREQQERVQRAIGELNDAQRQCLVLRAQGFRYREIAEVVGLSVSTVGEHVQRGLSKIRESL
jgi:RNA polymerase sigma-70 factor (ECF subfamily)